MNDVFLTENDLASWGFTRSIIPATRTRTEQIIWKPEHSSQLTILQTGLCFNYGVYDSKLNPDVTFVLGSVNNPHELSMLLYISEHVALWNRLCKGEPIKDIYNTR